MANRHTLKSINSVGYNTRDQLRILSNSIQTRRRNERQIRIENRNQFKCVQNKATASKLAYRKVTKTLKSTQLLILANRHGNDENFPPILSNLR